MPVDHAGKYSAHSFTSERAADPRAPLIDALYRRFKAESWVRAAWLGGSDASGRADALSDVDLVLLVEDDAVERAFAATEEALREIASVARSLRLPEPTWHGHAQAFYQLDGW